MPNPLISTDAIIESIDDQHDAEGIDSSTPLTFTNALMEPIKDAVGDVNDNVSRYYNRGILALATSEDLEEVSAEYGVTRSATSYITDDTSTNFHLDISPGITSDYALDTAAPIIISAEAVSIRDSNGNIYYASEDFVFPVDGYSAYVPITAGSIDVTDVGVNEINECTIDITEVVNLNPTVADQITFSCSNNKAITSAVSAFSDEELRTVAILRVNSMNNTNEDAIRLVLFNLGITDVDFVRDMYGFGTIGVIARINGSSAISESTINKLNNIVMNVCPSARLVVPEVLRIRFRYHVEYVDSSQSIETNTEIGTSTATYIDGLGPGEQMNPERMIDILSSINNVSKISIRCMFIDGRKALIRIQPALRDQVYELDIIGVLNGYEIVTTT